MVNWIGISFIVRMTAGLAFVGIVGALTIDNQLTVIKNDCFERLAIGQKLSQRDIYISLDVNTVPDCQRECTKDEEKCRSFSFGIGVKGNASCELSSKVVKETIDLKPIGTVSDQDFDLYIKKLGCKLIIEHKPIDITTQSGEPTSLFGAESKPEENSKYNQENKKPESNYRPDSIRDNQRPYPEKVHTDLISVRPDPNRPSFTGLGPALGFFDLDQPIAYEFDGRPVRPLSEERPNYHDRPRPKPSPGFDPGYLTPDIDRFDKPRRPYVNYYNADRPPFRPQVLNHPYDNDYMKPRPRPNGLDRIDGPDSGYGPNFKPKPISEIPNRPTHRPRPEYERFEFDLDRPYFDRPRPEYDRPTDRPRPEYDDGPGTSYGDRPDFDRPRPEFDRPQSGYGSNERPRPDMVFRPMSGFGGSGDRPGYSRPDDRPRPDYSNPDNGPDEGFGYGRPDYIPRPSFGKPNQGSGYGRPDDRPRPGFEKPHDRPGYGDPDDRPRPGYGRPDERPEYGRPDDRPRPDYNKPNNGAIYGRPDERPSSGYEKPDDRPEYNRPDDRPRPGYERPGYDNRPNSGYGKPDDRPGGGGYDKPNTGYESGSRPGHNKPNSDYNKPDNGIRPVFENPEKGGNNKRPGYGVDVDKAKPDSSYGSSSNSYNQNILSRPYDPNNPNVQYGDEGNTGYKDMLRPININLNEGDGYGKDGADVNKIGGSKKPEDPHGKPIITHMIGPHGEQITSIITELKPSKY